MIYHLFVCKHWPRYKLVTTRRSFIAPTGPLSLVNIIGEKQSGRGSIFSIKCSHCGHVNEVKSSGEHRARSRGQYKGSIRISLCWHGEYTLSK